MNKWIWSRQFTSVKLPFFLSDFRSVRCYWTRYAIIFLWITNDLLSHIKYILLISYLIQSWSGKLLCQGLVFSFLAYTVKSELSISLCPNTDVRRANFSETFKKNPRWQLCLFYVYPGTKTFQDFQTSIKSWSSLPKSQGVLLKQIVLA